MDGAKCARAREANRQAGASFAMWTSDCGVNKKGGYPSVCSSIPIAAESLFVVAAALAE